MVEALEVIEVVNKQRGQVPPYQGLQFCGGFELPAGVDERLVADGKALDEHVEADQKPLARLDRQIDVGLVAPHERVGMEGYIGQAGAA